MDGRLPTAHPWGIVVSIHHPWMRRTPTHSQGHPFRATDQRPSPNGFEFACGRACIHGWPWIPHVSMDQNSWTLVRGDRPMDTHRTLVGTAKAGDTFVLGGRSASARTSAAPSDPRRRRCAFRRAPRRAEAVAAVTGEHVSVVVTMDGPWGSTYPWITHRWQRIHGYAWMRCFVVDARGEPWTPAF